MKDADIEQLALEMYPLSDEQSITQNTMNRAFQEVCILFAKNLRGLSVPVKHYKAAPDDMFDIDCYVTGCCGVGPITNENYCPNCGVKIEK